MASTEKAPPRIDALTLDDLPAALELSASAAWNQNEADWRTMLTTGRGWKLRAPDAQGRERLAASTVVVPYSSGFAWISMVLVRPDFRRRGFASLLLRTAMDVLGRRGIMPILDATPAGHPVYAKEGFADTWGFARYRRDAPADPGGPVDSPSAATDGARPRPLQDRDWPAIGAIDAPAFGADRLALLRTLAARAPDAAWVLERGDRIEGFVLGRDGREATQLGPLLASDPDDARTLLDCALRRIPGPVHVDLTDRHRTLLPWLESRGFRFQRPFMRMVYAPQAAPAAPGDPAPIVLVAGPELG